MVFIRDDAESGRDYQCLYPSRPTWDMVTRTDDETLAALDRFKRDIDYFQCHYKELLERYPEQWIAIYQEAVAGVSPEFDALLADLRRRGVPPEHSLIKHLTHRHIMWILLRW